LPEHGGRLLAAAQQYGIPAEDWVDLSTGISPWARVPDEPPISVWQRLPEEEDGLMDAATRYYGTGALLATPGTQAALQALPRLRQPGRVAITKGSYAEHAAAWRAAGHEVTLLDDHELVDAAETCDAVVVVNPDNPTGREMRRATLLSLRAHLAARGGWLVVDEAFVDPHVDTSLAALSGTEGLVVLRSLGKFFGLAGVRLGFAGMPPALREAMAAHLGPWAVANPARWAGMGALNDEAWQQQQRERLREAGERLDDLMGQAGLPVTGGTALFRYSRTDAAPLQAHTLASAGVLVRTFDDPPALRLGLPATETAWQRLANALPQARTTP
jgi:cobalamin biosynthetic protein CobC